MTGCRRYRDEEGFSHLNSGPEEETSNATSYFNRSRHMALHAFNILEQFFFICCEASCVRQFTCIELDGFRLSTCCGIRAGSELVVEAASRLYPLERWYRCNGLPL